MLTVWSNYIKKQTRGDHLLDLVIKDFQACAVDILPAISDNHIVLAKFNFGISKSNLITRAIFEFSKID